MFFRKVAVALACFIALTACQKKIDVTGISDAQTVDYFLKHPDIAMTIAAKCDDFERKGFSKMSSAEQASWHDSTDGINCKNSGTAAALHAWNERQRKLREAASEYK